jgi:hypothetical protein
MLLGPQLEEELGQPAPRNGRQPVNPGMTARTERHQQMGSVFAGATMVDMRPWRRGTADPAALLIAAENGFSAAAKTGPGAGAGAIAWTAQPRVKERPGPAGAE